MRPAERVKSAATTGVAAPGSETGPAPALEVADLTVVYGGRFTAVEGASLIVRGGEIVTVSGANGAGKSSLLKGILGLAPVTGGSVRFRGAGVARRRPHQLFRSGIGYVPETDKVFPWLTVDEHLALASSGRRDRTDGRPARTRADVLDTFPTLRARLDSIAGNLSGGERQMLALSVALLRGPELLIVDEMSLGLAPEIISVLVACLERVAGEGVGVLAVQESNHEDETANTSTLIMESGRLTHG